MAERKGDVKILFTSAITMEGGVPKITWTPDLGEEHLYKVLGQGIAHRR